MNLNSRLARLNHLRRLSINWALLKSLAVGVVFVLMGIDAAAGPVNRALLVGVSKYPNLAPRWQLEGPPNDVRLFEQLLRGGRLAHFNQEDIRVLAGWPDDASLRPTRTNIEREFKRLAADAQPGDQIVILMAGHGSQQPSADDPEDPEPDGLDETFLPADVGDWDGRSGTVTNAITDDEIRKWLHAIRARGALIWILFDSCHSGTMTRGDAERVREVPASALVPANVLSRRPVQTRGMGSVADEPFGAGDIAAIYAAQPFEVTPEKILPEGSSTWHGVFTYYIVEVLAQTLEPLTYQELTERVNQRYRSLGRFGPTPAFEGGAIQRVVLGGDQLLKRPAMLLGEQRSDGQWVLRAGALHGLSMDSVLAVYPPAGLNQTGESVGYVRVTALDATKAAVTPIPYRDLPIPVSAQLALGSRCQIVSVGLSSRVLTVGSQNAASPPVAEALRRLQKMSNGAATAVAAGKPPDWLVVQERNDVWVEPATYAPSAPTGAASGNPPPAFSRVYLGTVSSASGEDLSRNLAQAASRIARATNLRRLSALSSSANSEDIRLEPSVLALSNKDDLHGVRVEFGSIGRVLHAGQWIEFRVRNTGNKPADITAFFIGSDFEIRPIFPAAERQMETRLEPGAEIVLARTQVTDETLGEEDLAVIGLSPAIPPVNLHVLAQAGATQRSRSAEVVRRQGLAGLVADALEGTRGVRRLDSDEVYAVALLSWRTLP